MLQTVDAVGRLSEVAGLFGKPPPWSSSIPRKGFPPVSTGRWRGVPVDFRGTGGGPGELCGEFANPVSLMLVGWDGLADVRDFADKDNNEASRIDHRGRP
jgi:hypothetical protein